MALTLKNKGYGNVKVVKGGFKAMRVVGFPIIWEGKIQFPKTGRR